MRVAILGLVLVLLGCAEPGSAAPTLTMAKAPIHLLPGSTTLQASVRGPRATPYRAELLGSRPERVEVTVTDVSGEAADISGVHLAFRPQRSGVAMQCPSMDDVPLREPHWIRPGETVLFERELCSLPLPGHYTVEVMLGFGEGRAVLAGRFGVDVGAKGPRVPHEVAAHPGLYAAMGADLTGVRYTAVEWKAGTYHIVARLTNASTDPVPVGNATVTFRVSKDRLPTACTSSHEVALPALLGPGQNVAVQVPVTCLIDVIGHYQVAASIAFPDANGETPLGAFDVEVTSDPLLYLPTWPVAPW